MTSTTERPQVMNSNPFKPLEKEDVAAFFGVSIRTLEIWMRDSKVIEPVRIGRRVLWHPDVFYSWALQPRNLENGTVAREAAANVGGIAPDRKTPVNSENVRSPAGMPDPSPMEGVVSPRAKPRKASSSPQRDALAALRKREQAKLDALLG